MFHALFDQIQGQPSLKDYADSHHELQFKLVCEGYSKFLETEKSGVQPLFDPRNGPLYLFAYSDSDFISPHYESVWPKDPTFPPRISLVMICYLMRRMRGDVRDLPLDFLLLCTVTVQSATMKLCLEFTIQDLNGKNTSERNGFIVMLRIDNCSSSLNTTISTIILYI